MQHPQVPERVPEDTHRLTIWIIASRVLQILVKYHRASTFFTAQFRHFAVSGEPDHIVSHPHITYATHPRPRPGLVTLPRANRRWGRCALRWVHGEREDHLPLLRLRLDLPQVGGPVPRMRGMGHRRPGGRGHGRAARRRVSPTTPPRCPLATWTGSAPRHVPRAWANWTGCSAVASSPAR